jgi:hypothetical protein
MADMDDYFGGADEAPAAKMGMDKEKPEEEHEGGKTAMLNKEVCPDKSVGDTMTLRVIADHDQEYEVEEVKDGEEEEAPHEEAAMPKGGGGEMQSMLE